MNYRILLIPLLLSAPFAAFARTRPAVHPSMFPVPKAVLWIGAHPDDESVAAPLLSLWCRDRHANCAFLIFTRGERSGLCLRPEGCSPDLATTRSAEAAAASQYFGARLILLTLPDGGGSAPPVWDLAPRTLATYIEAVNPDLILTFDPRHGSTCHQDHRAVGSLVLEAVKMLDHQPDVFLLETRITMQTDPLVVQLAPAIPNGERFDAASTWQAFVDDITIHASQFDAQWIAALNAVPISERAVFIAPAAAALQTNSVPCQRE